MKKKEKANGFTLIELLATIAIISILFFVAIPNITGLSDDIRKDNMLKDARKFVAQARYEVNKNYSIRNSNEYIFPDSAERYLQEEELYGYSAQELAYARNEIYARHGCVFNSEELNNYFKSKSWYVIDELYDGSLTDIERTNAKLIAEYQVNNNLEYKPQ